MYVSCPFVRSCVSGYLDVHFPPLLYIHITLQLWPWQINQFRLIAECFIIDTFLPAAHRHTHTIPVVIVTESTALSAAIAKSGEAEKGHQRTTCCVQSKGERANCEANFLWIDGVVAKEEYKLYFIFLGSGVRGSPRQNSYTWWGIFFVLCFLALVCCRMLLLLFFFIIFSFVFCHVYFICWIPCVACAAINLASVCMFVQTADDRFYLARTAADIA